MRSTPLIGERGSFSAVETDWKFMPKMRRHAGMRAAAVVAAVDLVQDRPHLDRVVELGVAVVRGPVRAGPAGSEGSVVELLISGVNRSSMPARSGR